LVVREREKKALKANIGKTLNRQRDSVHRDFPKTKKGRKNVAEV
jgi:hypothetical protein